VVALWVVPSLLLLAGLLVAQAYLARRFRRRLSIPLALATALLLALAASGVTVALARHRLASAGADMTRVTGEQAAAVDYSDYQGEIAVGGLIGMLCQGQPTGCTPTVARFRSSYRATGWVPGTLVPSSSQIAADTGVTMAQLGSADDGYGMQFAVPAVGIVIAILIAAGLQSRIDEYR
jgi:hypothetical protein